MTLALSSALHPPDLMRHALNGLLSCRDAVEPRDTEWALGRWGINFWLAGEYRWTDGLTPGDV